MAVNPFLFCVRKTNFLAVWHPFYSLGFQEPWFFAGLLFDIFSYHNFSSTCDLFLYVMSMTVTSGGDKNRTGGPQVPEPLLT